VAEGLRLVERPRMAEAAASEVRPKVGGDCSCMRGEVGTRGRPDLGLLLQVGELCSDRESTGGSSLLAAAPLNLRPLPCPPGPAAGGSSGSEVGSGSGEGPGCGREVWCSRGLWGSWAPKAPGAGPGPAKGEAGRQSPSACRGRQGARPRAGLHPGRVVAHEDLLPRLMRASRGAATGPPPPQAATPGPAPSRGLTARPSTSPILCMLC